MHFLVTFSNMDDSPQMAACPNCNTRGPIRNYCTECEDQGYVYELIDSESKAKSKDDDHT
jgi:hypothetical protein